MSKLMSRRAVFLTVVFLVGSALYLWFFGLGSVQSQKRSSISFQIQQNGEQEQQTQSPIRSTDRESTIDRISGSKQPKQQLTGKEQQLRSTFEDIAKYNRWHNKESISGPGSTVAANLHRVRCMRDFIKARSIRNVIDIPCGDATWQHGLILDQQEYVGSAGSVRYWGGDISEFAVGRAQKKNQQYIDSGLMRFRNESLNLVSDVPHSVVDWVINGQEGDHAQGKQEVLGQTMWLNKEAVQHLPLEHGMDMLSHIIQTGVRYLAASQHEGKRNKNQVNFGNITAGQYYDNDVTQPPFDSLPLGTPVASCLKSTAPNSGTLLIFDLWTAATPAERKQREVELRLQQTQQSRK